MPAPIPDERTGRPVDYEALLREAQERAASLGVTLPAACLAVAEDANAAKADSIERHLRRLRGRREVRPKDPAQTTAEAIPGFGVWGRDLQTYAQNLEDQINEISDRQTYSGHRMRQLRERAERVYDLASRRLDYLERVGREQAVELLGPHLDGLGDLDSTMEPAALYDGEVRLVTVVLHMTSRVIQKADSALEFLEDR